MGHVTPEAAGPSGALPPDWSDWLAVCGIKREAAIWGGRAVCGGGRSDLLSARLAAAIAEHRPAGLISFGVCGELADRHAVGDLVTGRFVTQVGGDRWLCDPALQLVLATATGAGSADVLGSDTVITDPARKAQLSAGAQVVDMESHLAARAAQAHGLPLLVLRAVSDDASHSLPPAAVAGMREDGRIDLAAILKSLASDPRQLPALIRMARTSGKAFKALETARARL